MPKIELTQEQADELMDLLLDKVQKLTEKMPTADPVTDMECAYRRHVYSDILHLLEIA